MDKPVSQTFLQVEHGSKITGTVPHDSESRPHVQASIDASALAGGANEDAKPIGIIGPAINGKPNHVYKITSLEQAKHIFSGGSLLTAIELAWQPSGVAYGNGGIIYAERVQDATKATLNTGALHFYSRAYGDFANNNEIALNRDPLENNTWDLAVKNNRTGYKAQYNGLGLLAHIQYIPNSWDKFHIPEGQKDYARASIQIVPKINKIRYSNGSSSETTNGQASKLIFKIHDTKKVAIFHNNATNNDNGGSTVYEVNDPGYNDSMPAEYQSDQSASAGDLNPARGPFVDSTFTVNLTDPKFVNMTNLLAYLQQLNFNGQAHLEVSANEDAHLSHIPPYMLDINEHAHSIMPNIDGTTEDNHGNILEPGSIWSTLGSIVDVLRYNPEVHAQADMKRQLNFISTVPASDNHLTSLATNYENSANAASLNASYDYSEASIANVNNVPSLANEYKDTGDSYAQNAQDYTDLAESADDEFWDKINAVTYGPTSADKSASSIASSANSEISANNSYAKSIAHNAVHASNMAKSSSTRAAHLMTSYNNAVASNKKALDSANSELKADKANYQNHKSTQLSTAINSVSAKATSLANNKFSSSEANTHASNAKIHENVFNKLTAEIHNLNAKNKEARANVSNAVKKAKASDSKNRASNRPSAIKNMQYVQNYTINLIKQLRNELFNHKVLASNIIDSDLDALSRVAHYMQHPANMVDSSIIKAGQKVAEPLMNALNDLKDYKNNVKGSGNALNIDLGYIESAINSAKSDKPAPKGILQNAYGDGVINVLGEPIHAFTDTFLSGGTTSQIPIDWSNKFKYFNDTPVYDFVAVSPRESVHANLASYIGDRYNASHNIRGFVGTDFNASAQELIDRSANLDNERICLYGTSGDYTIDDGVHEDIPGYLGAAIIAGIDSSLAPGESIVNKKVGYNKIDQHFSSSELDALNANGVITANPVVNRGVDSEFTISNDVTTNNDSSDPVKAELSVGEVTDYLFDELRTFLQNLIGTTVTVGSADQIKTSVNAFLHNHCSKYNGGEGLIVDFKPDDTFCEIHNESAWITFNVAPTRPLKYISVVGKYSGYDETSDGDNSGATFQFIGTNGVMSSDDDSDDDGGSGEDANDPSGVY